MDKKRQKQYVKGMRKAIKEHTREKKALEAGFSSTQGYKIAKSYEYGGKTVAMGTKVAGAVMGAKGDKTLSFPERGQIENNIVETATEYGKTRGLLYDAKHPEKHIDTKRHETRGRVLSNLEASKKSREANNEGKGLNKQARKDYAADQKAHAAAKKKYETEQKKAEAAQKKAEAAQKKAEAKGKKDEFGVDLSKADKPKTQNREISKNR